MAPLPYYFVCRLRTGRWGVVHRVAATGVDHVDADCPTLRAAQIEAARLNEQRECGLQRGTSRPPHHMHHTTTKAHP